MDMDWHKEFIKMPQRMAKACYMSPQDTIAAQANREHLKISSWKITNEGGQLRKYREQLRKIRSPSSL